MMKVLVSDYDRTLYRNDEEIKLNVESINKFIKNNNIFIIATGRSELDIKTVIKKYNINYNYLIVNHGASIIKNDKVIYNVSIDNNIKNNILEILKNYKYSDLFVCTKENSRANITETNLTKIHVTFNNKNMTSSIKKLLEDKYSKFVNIYFASQGSSLEIVPASVGKVIALDYLSELENFDKKFIYTVGDDISDKCMLEKYNGYAIDSAIKEIKETIPNKCTSVFDLVNTLNKK